MEWALLDKVDTVDVAVEAIPHIKDMAETARQGTRDAYAWSLTAFERVAKPKRLAEVTVPVLERFAAQRAIKVAKPTVNKDLRAVRAFLRWCADDDRGYLLRVPDFRKAMIRLDEPLPTWVEPIIIDRMIAAVEQTEDLDRPKVWWRMYLQLLRYSGCRRSELLDLDWTQVVLTGPHARMTILLTKGRQPKVLPLLPEIIALLAEYHQQVGVPSSGPVFPWPEGLTVRAIYRDWGRISKAAGLGSKRFRPKDLRSSRASELIAAGIPLNVVQAWLGHSAVITTARYYCRVDVESLRRAVAKRP